MSVTYPRLAAVHVLTVDVNYGGETYRETGASLILEINYENFRGWPGVGSISYSYTPMLVRGSSYKHYTAEYAAYRTDRTLLNQHGIFIEAVQGGSLKGFSFNNLLIQLTTSLTLFATATVLTDFLAMYVLPDHAAYETFKYESTPDFGDLRDERERALLEAPPPPAGAEDASSARLSGDGSVADWASS